ncbi:MAG: hypothetical protein IPN90_13695 [Elusimicrobia bacterium]|nr:hypothetical protein [Elusimicrobiota bacterium]
MINRIREEFRIPFTQKIFANVNRLTLDAKLGFDRRISNLNFERDNTDTYTAESTGNGKYPGISGCRSAGSWGSLTIGPARRMGI